MVTCKKIYSVLLFVIMGVATPIIAQTTEEYWESFSEKQLKKINAISFNLTIHLKTQDIDTIISHCAISADSNCKIINEDGYCFTKVTKDSILVIDKTHANISYGPKEYDWKGLNGFRQLYDKHSHDIGIYSPFYHNPGSAKYRGEIKEIKDSANFTILTTQLLTGYRFNDDTQEYDIPVIKTIKIYCDNNSGWIPEVDIKTPEDIEYKYYFTNINVSSNAHLYDSDFNLSNIEYKTYSYYDLTKTFAPSEIAGTERPRDTILTNEILSFPLSGADGDTVYLRDEAGWILIEFWTYGCKPCAKFLQTIQDEKNSLGYRRLENEGINIYCINTYGGVTEHMIQYAKTFDAEDIVYSSRQMIALDYTFTPTYYLFAPNRDLVYRGYDKDIINTLLKAKRNYKNN